MRLDEASTKRGNPFHEGGTRGRGVDRHDPAPCIVADAGGRVVDRGVMRLGGRL